MSTVDLYEQYTEEGHLLTVEAVWRDPAAYCRYLEDDGGLDWNTEHTADTYTVVCVACGASPEPFSVFRDAQWWAREHRLTYGLEPQRFLPTLTVVDGLFGGDA